MTQTEMEEKLEEEVKGLSTYLEGDDYTNACNDASMETGWSFPVSTDFKILCTNACNDASMETGWSFPVSTDFKILWMKQRAKRALFFYLFSESAHKFKYEQINLNQRFDHYKIIIETMDKSFAEALEANPQEFANVEAYELFGTSARAEALEANPQEFANVEAYELFGTSARAGYQYDPITGKDTTYSDDNKTVFTPGGDND